MSWSIDSLENIRHEDDFHLETKKNCEFKIEPQKEQNIWESLMMHAKAFHCPLSEIQLYSSWWFLFIKFHPQTVSQSLKWNIEKNLSMGNDDHAKIENGKEEKIGNNKR